MKIIDSVHGELERKEIRLDFDGGAKVVIQRNGKAEAVIYTMNLPTLKKELREYAMNYPELVDVIADDPEADATDAEGNLDKEKLAADRGLMIAKVYTNCDGRGLALVLTPVDGCLSLAIHDPAVSSDPAIVAKEKA